MNAFLSYHSGHVVVFPAWQMFLLLPDFSLHKHPSPHSVYVLCLMVCWNTLNPEQLKLAWGLLLQLVHRKQMSSSHW